MVDSGYSHNRPTQLGVSWVGAKVPVKEYARVNAASALSRSTALLLKDGEGRVRRDSNLPPAVVAMAAHGSGAC